MIKANLLNNSIILPAALLAMISILLPACTTLQSIQLGEQTITPEKGVGYCLPMGKVTVEIWKNLSATGGETSLLELNAQRLRQNVSMQGELLPVNAENEAPQLDPMVDIPLADEARPQEPPIEDPTLREPYNPGVQAQAASFGSFRPFRIAYKETKYVPDPSKRFAVRYTGNVMMADEIKVIVTKESLLDKITVSTDDKTLDVVKKVLEIGKNLFRISSGGGIKAQSGGGEELIFSASFDPTSPGELAKINSMLLKVDGGPYKAELISLSDESSKAPTSTYRTSADTSGRFEGVAFRPALAYGLALSRNGVVEQVSTVMLPNEAEILYMPVNRSAFVKKVQELDFNEGMLVEATINKPSEALGFVEIPLEITRAILALPGEIAADNIAALKRKTSYNDEVVKAIKADGLVKREVLDDRIQTQKKEIEAAETQKEHDRVFEGGGTATAP